MYIIKGYDRRYESKRKAKCYGKFDSLAECLPYLNKLKTGPVGGIMKFWWEEI